ncbi:MAG: hypothetical protein MUF34_04145 [Polyangiaceae bacterium]|nr:hypothetical protein [Polyangiaceae bacterium]
MSENTFSRTSLIENILRAMSAAATGTSLAARPSSPLRTPARAQVKAA